MLLLLAVLLAPNLGPVYALLPMPDDGYVAATSRGLVRLKRGGRGVHWRNESRQPLAVATTPDKKTIIEGSMTGQVTWSNARNGVETGRCRATLPGAIVGIAATNTDLVAVSRDGGIQRCRLKDGAALPLPLHVIPPTDVAIARDYGPGVHPRPTAFQHFTGLAATAEHLILIGEGFHDGGHASGVLISGWRDTATAQFINVRQRPHWPALPHKRWARNPWSQITSARFSPAGDRVALGYFGGGIEVLDLTRPVASDQAFQWADATGAQPIRSICWQPDGTLLAADWQTVRAFDAQTGRWVEQARIEPNDAVGCGSTPHLARSAGLRPLHVRRPFEHDARLAPEIPERFMGTEYTPPRREFSFKAAPDDVWLAPPFFARRMLLIDAQHAVLMNGDHVMKVDRQGRLVWRSAGTGASVYASVRLDAQHFAVGDGRGKIAVYRLTDGKRLADLPGTLVGWVHALAVHPDGDELVAGTVKGDIGRWRISDRTRLPTPAPRTAPRSALQVAVEPTDGFVPLTAIEYITDMHFAPDGALLVTGHSKVGVLMFEAWPRLDNAVHLSQAGHIQSGRFSPDGRHIALGGWQGAVLLLNRAGAVVGVHGGHRHNVVFSMAWQPDGSGVWAEGAKHQVWMHRSGWAKVVGKPPTDGFYRQIAVDPTGAHLARLSPEAGLILSPSRPPTPLKTAVEPALPPRPARR